MRTAFNLPPLAGLGRSRTANPPLKWWAISTYAQVNENPYRADRVFQATGGQGLPPYHLWDKF